MRLQQARFDAWRADTRLVRQLSKDDNIRLKRHQPFVNCALATEWVGFEEVADRVWSLHFYDRLPARLDERTHKLRG